MKITEVEPIVLTVRARWLWGTRPHNFSFVRVHTDAGLCGTGESLLGYYVPEQVPPLVAHFGHVVRGRDPFAIEALRDAMFIKALRWGHVGPAVSVLGAIEMALWDLLGKALDVPLYQLLGGLAQDRLRCYASTGSPAWPMDRTLSQLSKLVDRGFSAVKTVHGYVDRPAPVGVAALVAQEVEKFGTLREHLGDDVDLMLDPAAPFNRAPWSGDTAVQVIRALDPFHLLWVEQPVAQTNVDDYVRIRSRCATPLAAGENATTVHDLKPFLERHALDIVQPDAAWCGGVGECLKMVAAAEAHDLRVAPHCFCGPVGLAANYHIACARRSCFIVEYPTHENPITAPLLAGAFTFGDGWLRPTGRPGLGIELDDALRAAHPFVPRSGLSDATSPFPRPVPPDWQAPTEDEAGPAAAMWHFEDPEK